jgi:ubiquinone/menaquinone biosynthesis C-methylase UbiE
MSKKYSLEQIREFWTQQAKRYGQSPSASGSDHRVIELEIQEILKRLSPGDRVLDMGCANGFSTLHYATQKKIKIKGLDLIPEMIEQARARLHSNNSIKGNVEFGVGDITKLKEKNHTYDKVIITRVLINLGSWERQHSALVRCAQALKRDGLLLISEATVQGWNQLNAFRHEWTLPPLPMPPFNVYIDEHRMVSAMARMFDLVEIVNFASTYFVATRVLKPLLIKALDVPLNLADPEMHWNKWFAQWPAIGNYGTQKLFVFRKR